MTSPLGVWTLLASYIESRVTRVRSYPFGLNPVGTLILHPDGRMIAMVTSGEVPDTAALFKPALAYSGRYQLEDPGRFVTHVDMSTLIDWIGTRQARNYSVEDDRLDIISDPFLEPVEKSEVVAVLSWKRERNPREE